MDYKNMTEDMAREGFGCGIDCSMAVAGHCADKVGIDESTAVKAMAAFGGGMWHGETCGAVVGALMSLGLKYGNCEPGDTESKNALLAKKGEIEAAFIEKFGTLKCKELLGYDLSIPEEMNKAMEEGLLMTLCPKLVAGACEIMDELL